MTTEFSIDAAGALPGPEWLVSRRRNAAQRFEAAELPTAEEEVWRYSRIGELDLASWSPPTSTPDHDPEALGDLAGLVSDGDTVVVTVDGHLVDHRTPDGSKLRVTSAADEPAQLGRAIGATDDPFTALNDAFNTPIEITVPDGVEGGRVVVIHRFVTEGVVAFPRLVVHAGQGSSATVVEVFASDDGCRTLALPITELVVDRDATLRHSTIQVLGDTSWQIARIASVVAQGATLRSSTAAFGGDYSRVRVDTELAGRGAHGDIFAGYFGTGTQLLDFRTFQDHAAPDTTSNLLFKGALGQKGASVYTGLIKIRPDAKGSQAFQTNRNLKLSDDAWAESVPNLEIENNEVQCSHASTVGPVDAEQRFYLESRGVPTERAERLIVKGFFDEVIDVLPAGGFEQLVRQRLDTDLERSMS